MDVTTYLEERRCRFERVPHEPTYSAQRMAHELHVPGREVAKTVLLRADGVGDFVVAVVPANRQIDLVQVAKLLRKKHVQLATEFDIADHCPDCEFGALPPFGSRYGMQTIVDSGLAADEQIVFEGNTHHEAIRMPFAEFCTLEKPLIAAFTSHPA